MEEKPAHLFPSWIPSEPIEKIQMYINKNRFKIRAIGKSKNNK